MIKPEIPNSIKNGHENLCSELEELIAQGGKVGECAKKLSNVMYSHFKKEEAFALPPLGFLLTLSEGHWEFDSNAAIEMSAILQSELSILKKEHENILYLAQKLKVVAELEGSLDAKRFVKDLTLHAAIEDQVLYPATLLIGEYLKNLKSSTS